ncbi:MAG: type II CRISPR-associated endonuclease Cas1 [Bacteroidales bacterium]|nr:type II CRISPR-associated endonuclease Cas1 [Bacteroidales bacterium]
MIKKTLYFGNPAYLSLHLGQLVIQLPQVQKNDTLPSEFKKSNERTVPIEDIGVVLLDNQRITITSGALDALLENNCAVITCNSQGMPQGLLLPLSVNTLQHERFLNQIGSSLPLQKQLWAQTVKQKILNQKHILDTFTNGIETNNMLVWANTVRSGDPDNIEARAAAYYWRNLFPQLPDFTRDRNGIPPNNMLNYGYAILRAVVARSLVASGLLPTLGIHHSNRYNAYCLADDIMEPYRPYVDKLVVQIMEKHNDIDELTRDLKSELLIIPVIDVVIDGKRSPLMVAVGQTTASLAKCYAGEKRVLSYPVM